MADEQPTPGTDPRISVRMRVRISTIDPETDPWTGKTYFRTSEETCANVSRGGAFVETREMIAPGRRLLLELELPGGHSVQAMGRVAWTKTKLSPEAPAGKNAESGIGVEFLGGPPDQRLTLERFLARSTRRQRLANDPATFYAASPRR
jgi:uncharacterized protein (TIGR02266 family)